MSLTGHTFFRSAAEWLEWREQLRDQKREQLKAMAQQKREQIKEIKRTFREEKLKLNIEQKQSTQKETLNRNLESKEERLRIKAQRREERLSKREERLRKAEEWRAGKASRKAQRREKRESARWTLSEEEKNSLNKEPCLKLLSFLNDLSKPDPIIQFRGYAKGLQRLYFFTIEDLCSWLQCSEGFIRKLAKDGKISGIRLKAKNPRSHHRILFPKSNVLAFLDSCRTPAKPWTPKNHISKKEKIAA